MLVHFYITGFFFFILSISDQRRPKEAYSEFRGEAASKVLVPEQRGQEEG